MKLFGRTLRLVVGTLDVSELDCSFSVKKTLKPEPNHAVIQIRNLSETSRRILETPKSLPVELHAGYGGENALIYVGELRAGITSQQGVDIVTTIESGDKESKFAGAHIRVSVGKGTSAGTAIGLLGDALGVGRGNLAKVTARLEASHKTLFPYGGTISGNVARQLTEVCKSAGLEWSILDGNLQILDAGAALDGTAIELGHDTGLVGSPEVDSKGFVHATCLLIPDLRPGGKVTFRTTAEIRGGYRIQEIEYEGDTNSNDWFAKIVAKQY